MQELFDIVDKYDNVIQSGVSEETLHMNNDITRVVTCYLCDLEGKFYIAKRSPGKKVDPLKFEAPAHGRVNSGESYEHAIIREAKEEVFVDIISLEEVAHYYTCFDTNVGKRQHWKKLFIGRCSRIDNFNTDEIYALKTFGNISAFLQYYEEFTGEFSNAVNKDIGYIKKYFKL